MKNRSTILMVIVPVLACFALLSTAQGQSNEGDLGNGNTVEGFQALFNNTGVGGFNTALGWVSLWNNADAFFNTGVGAGTLFNNNAADNTAVGAAALFFNTFGADNTAVGTNALLNNDLGNPGPGSSATANTAVGVFALAGDATLGNTGSDNNAIGHSALFSNQSGIENQAMGNSALFSNTTGNFNVAIGHTAMLSSNSNFNTAVGFNAGENLTAPTFDENIYIGDTAGTLDFLGVSPGNEFGVIRIGSVFSGTLKCFINGILPNVIPQAPGNTIVTIDPVTGQLGNTTDFAANKVAEQQKQIEEQQASIAELKSTVAQQAKGMEVLTAQLKEQAAQIQKVSAQLEVSKPAPQVVVNKP